VFKEKLQNHPAFHDLEWDADQCLGHVRNLLNDGSGNGSGVQARGCHSSGSGRIRRRSSFEMFNSVINERSIDKAVGGASAGVEVIDDDEDILFMGTKSAGKRPMHRRQSSSISGQPTSFPAATRRRPSARTHPRSPSDAADVESIDGDGLDPWLHEWDDSDEAGFLTETILPESPFTSCPARAAPKQPRAEHVKLGFTKFLPPHWGPPPSWSHSATMMRAAMPRTRAVLPEAFPDAYGAGEAHLRIWVQRHRAIDAKRAVPFDSDTFLTKTLTAAVAARRCDVAQLVMCYGVPLASLQVLDSNNASFKAWLAKFTHRDSAYRFVRPNRCCLEMCGRSSLHGG
jgi:hypothetical protein